MTPVSTPPSPNRLLCVLFPDWPIQRLLSLQPDRPREPIALFVKNGQLEKVVACSPEARQLGVYEGQRVPDATSLAGPGQLQLLPSRPNEDRRALERLAKAAERFAPIVALEASETPSALLLDVTGLALLWGDDAYGGETRLVRAVSEWASGERLIASVSVAASIGIALSVARHEGAIIVTAEQTDEVVRRQPIDALRVDPKISEALGELGIERIGQLMSLPREALPSRFGHE
ncbi:MAG: DNA polymerase Y family protein, partial [Planctomycetota bacterium]